MDQREVIDERVRDAKRHVSALKGFYSHLIVFAFVMLLLLAVNILTVTPWWVQWVFLGWGTGVIAHALFVFSNMTAFVRDWEARQIKAYLAKRSGDSS